MTSTHRLSDPFFERVKHPDILPLEISNLQVAGVTLWEASQSPAFGKVLARILETWLVGGTADRSDDLPPASFQGCQAIFLSGGRSMDDNLRAELKAVRIPIVFDRDPIFGGERGGFEFLRLNGYSGWTVDLGKSKMKISTPNWRGEFPRDWNRIPLAVDVPESQIPAQCRRLQDFIAISLQKALIETNTVPQAIVFALPTRLSEDGTPGTSNYAGMRGNGRFLRAALDQAGLFNLPLFLLNDAELTALTALTDSRLNTFRKVLVLTLGFGIGAAVIQRSNG